MPRTKLDKFSMTPEKRMNRARTDCSRAIRRAMVTRDIRYDKDVAAAIGMMPATFSAKMRSGAWTWEDLYKLCVVLEVAPDALLGTRMEPVDTEDSIAYFTERGRRNPCSSNTRTSTKQLA